MRLFLFPVLILAILGCKKTNEIGEGILSQPSATDSFYFNASFNGTNVMWLVPSKYNQKDYTYNSSASFGYDTKEGSCTETYCHYLSANSQIFLNVPDVRPQINIGFNMAAQQFSRQEYLSWFSTGLKIYSPGRENTVADRYNPSKNGAVVFYIDQNGKSWSSTNGSQQDSYFESVSLVDLPGINNGYLNKIWKAKFSCKLYDGLGNSIQIENAEMYNRIMLP